MSSARVWRRSPCLGRKWGWLLDGDGEPREFETVESARAFVVSDGPELEMDPPGADPCLTVWVWDEGSEKWTVSE